MAKPKSILTLDLGTQTVSLAEFQSNAQGGLVLANHRSTELLADPAADATRQAQARIAVGEMAATAGYKGRTINYAIASQAVFTRFVKLPSVGESQVDQIVTFEAQQNVPYPINEVVWDYQLVEGNDPSQVEVVIVAIKSDLLDEINTSVEEAGLKTALVDVAPMAVYNAFRYNYADLEGCSLIVDLGGRTTNLIFIEPHKIFSRSISTGGNSITAAIAKDLDESFGAAEERKKKDGFVSLGGAYAEPDDPEVGRVSKVIRNTMTRLHAEISRSISFYRSQQGGGQPQRVFLAGGSASLPYMREFFQEKFSMPVEFFNPLRNVTVAPSLDLEDIGRQAHTMGEMVGLALRGISACPMELNLRPPSVVRRHEMASRTPAMVLAGVCLLLTLAAFYLYYDRAATATLAATEIVAEKVGVLKPIEAKMNAISAAVKEQGITATPLLQAVRERDYWAEVISDINARLPKDYVWVTAFEPVPPPPEAPPTAAKPTTTAKAKAGAKKEEKPQTLLKLTGLYLLNERNTAVVDEFINRLGESPLYTVNKEELQRSVPNETDWAFDWSVPLALKDPIALPPAPRQ